MSLTVYTEPQLVELAIGYIARALQSRNPATGPKSLLGQLARAEAQLLGAIQAAQQQADNDACPALRVDAAGQVQSKTSRERLEDWAQVFALPSNRGDGIFGSNGATAATGGIALITGVAGTIVPTGATLTDPSGTITIFLVAGVTIPIAGSISGSFAAVSIGAAGNLPANTVLTWQSPPPGLDSTVVLSTGLSRGFDEEPTLDLALRLIRHMQLLPKGGAANDFRTWAEQSTDSAGRPLGINRAYVYPHRNGTLSVDIVITQAGTGTGRDPGAVIAAQVQSYVLARKIATDSVRVLRPRFVVGEPLFIEVKIVPRSGYEYDWEGSTTVDAYVALATTIDIPSPTPPPGLQTAIDTGLRPRIQLACPSTPLPVQRRVTAYAANTPAAGKCRLTLESALPSVPSAGQIIYAGGPAVDIVALAVLSHLDTIGPSRQSGYADPLDNWVDRVAVSGICQAVIDARDTDGTGPALYLPDAGIQVGVRIKVSPTGSFSGNDYQLFDNLPGQPPQLPIIQSILVPRY